MSEQVNEVGAGAVAGFQVPLGIRKRKKKVDELLVTNRDINEGHALVYFSSLDEAAGEEVGQKLDAGDASSVAAAIRDHAIRELIRSKVREIVRKKGGGGGYVLYSPNSGKKKPAKAVGTFPTKIGAKRAELSRFPPRDPRKLVRLRRDVDRLSKDPKKRAEREKRASQEKGTDLPKKEGLDLLRSVVSRLIGESLFREERTGSEWDEQIAKLSKQAVSADKKFQTHQKTIEKRTAGMLGSALGSIKKAVGKDVKLKDFGIKRDETRGKTYVAFGATIDDVAVEPIYIYVEAGVPKIEVSDTARVALTKAEPGKAKLFRAELVTVQERVLDRMEDLTKAIEARDKYLTKIQDEVDSFVAGLTPLQLSLLKSLLVKKYRKMT